LVVGDGQIRAQVRSAFLDAMAAAPLPPQLIGVFERALRAARTLQLATPFGHQPSIASAGVDVALSAPELRDRPLHTLRIVVLGAGAIGKAALSHLIGLGAQVTLLNRTLTQAQRLANFYGGAVTSAALVELPERLQQADLVVCGTASRSPVLDRTVLQVALGARAARPVVVLDLAVPRDVEPSVRDLRGVRLIDLDDLARLCPIDAAERALRLTRVEEQAVHTASEIDAWLRLRAAAPAIVEFRSRGQQMRCDELRRVAPRLKDLSPAQMGAVEELTERIVNKLLHAPTVALRERASAHTAGRAIA
ncbi:MAG: hypothetical protein JOZ87_13200, partial [Chloroflexi bacterium]|nr:hypothetical protein [Chloroflexota bacterium]